MLNFLKRRKIQYVEPVNRFEKLEDRIVLDASLAPTNDQAAQTDAAESAETAPIDAPDVQDSLQDADNGSHDQSDSAVDTSEWHAPAVENPTDYAAAVDGSDDSSNGIRVLLISSQVEDSAELADAAQSDVITIIYDALKDSPSDILHELSEALGNDKAQSIGLVSHDMGESTFHLTGDYYVSAETISDSPELQTFWASMGLMVSDGGGIDLMACNLTATEDGHTVVSVIEQLSGRSVAASDDPTGNESYGGDWILETGAVDLTARYFDSQELDHFDGRLATIDITFLSGKTGWATVMEGSMFDPSRDLQANVQGQDLLGDDYHGVLYTAYDDKGTVTTDDDVIAYRVRLDGADSKDNLAPFVVIGLDADLDGDIDLFVSLDPGTKEIWLFDTGGDLNVSPSTTSYSESYDSFGDPNSWAFDTATNYSFIEVSSANDPDFTASDDPDGAGPITSDISLDGENDRFVSFIVPFKAIQDELLDDQGISVTPDTPMRYILATSTQNNAVNSDIGGVGKDGIRSKLTWEELGTFSPVLSLSNILPVGSDDSFSLEQDTSVTFTAADLLANDTDANGDPLSLQVLTQPSNGDLSLNLDGTYTYAPTNGYAGTDSFTYTLSDGKANALVPVTVTFTVTPAPGANNVPTAVNDSYSTNEDTPVSGNVLSNDTDADLDPLNATLQDGPSHGVLTLNEDGSFNYTPEADYYGQDSFTYFANDGANDSASPATVSVTITPTPDNAFALGDEDTVIVVTLLESDANGVITALGDPGNGAVTVGPDGKTVFYTPYENYNGTDTFDYTLTYPGGSTFEGTATVTVNPVNDPPTATNDQLWTNEDHAVTFSGDSLKLNDTDVEGDTLFIDIASVGTDAQHGTVTYNGDGTFTYTPDENFSGVDTFTYVVADRSDPTDPERLTDVGTVTVTVDELNTAPVADDQTENTPEDTPVTITPVMADQDNDPLSLEIVTGPANGSVVVNPDGTFTYTPKENWFGADTFVYRASDGEAGDNATVTVVVEPVNDDPSAGTDLLAVVEGSDKDTPANKFTLEELLANDTDVETPSDLTIDPLTLSDPPHGSVIDNGDGTYSYVPDAGFSGADSFTYTLSDGHGGSVTGVVTVIVTPTPQPPVANDDSVTLNEDSSVTINVLGNDSDPDGDALTVQLLGDVSNGDLKLNPDGTFTYTPAPNFSGTDSFTYKVIDATNNEDTATVSLTINAVNDDPMATDDTLSVNEDSSVEFDPSALLGNDSDVDGGTLTIQSTTDGSHGTVVFDGSKYTYTPDPNFNGTDVFTYVVSDGNGGTDTAVVTVTVKPDNDAPDAVDDSLVSRENGSVTFDPMANDSDVDGDTLSVTGFTQAAHGSVTANLDGTLTYKPDTGFSGGDSFTYTISDGNGGEDTATVNITVSDEASAPVAEDQSLITPEDTSIEITPDATDPDGQPLTFTILSGTTNGTLTFDDISGKFTYTPDENWSGNDSFIYRASDGTFSDTATVFIEVTPVNDLPVAGPDHLTVDEDSDQTYPANTVNVSDLLVNDSDAETLAKDLVITAVGTAAHGTVTFDSGAGNITYVPDPDFSGDDSFTYTLQDEDGGEATGTVIVTVNPADDPPAANDDSVTVSEDGSIKINISDLLSNDVDPDGNPIILATDPFGDPSHGAIVDNGDGTVTYTPDPNYSGPDSFTYQIDDGAGGTVTATVNIGVQPVNDAPIAQDDSFSVDEDAAAPLSRNVLSDNGAGQDTDADGDSLETALLAGPSHGTLTGGGIGTDGSFEYTPDPGYYGVDTFTYTVSDGKGGTDTGTVTITVTPVNDDPVAYDDTFSGSEDNFISGNVLGDNGSGADSDPDGDYLTATVSSGTANGFLVLNADGSFVYTPAYNWSGTDTFTYTVSDGTATSNTATVTLNVISVNDDPIAVNDSATVDTGATVTIDVLANDSDPDGPTPSISTFDGASTNGGTITKNLDDTLTYDPLDTFTGTDTFTYTISDGAGGFDTATVTVTVTGNMPPDASDAVFRVSKDVTTLSGNVNAYFSDPDSGDSPHTVSTEWLNPTEGSVTGDANGNFTWTGSKNNTEISFDYAVTDDAGHTVNAKVYIFRDNNDGQDTENPQAGTDRVSTPMDNAAIIDVLANDVDPDNTSAPYNAGLTVTEAGATTPPSHGTVSIGADNQITYTPNTGYIGPDTFSYTIADSSGRTDTGTVEVTVYSSGSVPSNNEPTAANDAVSVNEGASVTFSVLEDHGGGADSDPDGDQLTVISVDASGSTLHGTLQWDKSGDMTYTPSDNWSGVDTFTYTVTDGNGGEDSATVTITVNEAANNKPVADPDALTTDENLPVIFTTGLLLSNDSDADGDALSISEVFNGANGVVTDNGDGTYTYTPDPGFYGSDSFEYTLSDGVDSVTGTVSVTVNETNSNPSAADDNVTTMEDSPITFSPLDNDRDPDGDALSISSIDTSGTLGTVTQSGGAVTYTPPANYNENDGADSFQYTVSDGHGGTDTAVVTITIKPINDPPDAKNDAFTVNEDSALTGNVFDDNGSGADTDVDGPGSIEASLVSGPSNGTVELQTDGSFSYMPNENYYGSDSFTYKISDGALEDVATVTITVTPENDAPVAEPDSYSVDEDNTLVITEADLLSNDSDLETPQANLAIVSVGTPDHGTLTDNGDGTYTYEPETDFNGTDSFTYTIEDENGASASAKVTISVKPVNDGPTALDDSVTSQEDSSVTIEVLANDSDPDGDNLIVSLGDNPTHGTATLNADGTFTYTPDPNWSGNDSFTYSIDDGHNPAVTAKVDVTVESVNDLPVAKDDSFTMSEDSASPLAGNVLVNNGHGADSDADTGDTLSVSLLSGPSFGVLNLGGDGAFTYTPNKDYFGTDTFTYTLSDGHPGGSDVGKVTITITPQNDAPVAVDDSVTTNEGSSVTFDARSNDTDVDHDSLEVTSVTAPTHGSVSVNANGSLTYTPDANFAGTDTFEYTISDGNGGEDTALITVTVNEVNSAPIANDQSITTDEDTPKTFAPDADDPDPDPDNLTYTIVSGPSHGEVVVNGDGTFTYTPDKDYDGPDADSFIYRVSDGDLSDTAVVTITVNPINDDPIAKNDGPDPANLYSVNEDESLTILTSDLLDNDSDAETPKADLVVTSVGTAGHGAVNFDSGSGEITYTPDADFNGTDSFTYTIEDEDGGTDTATVFIDVIPQADDPIANNETVKLPEDSSAVGNVLLNDNDPDGTSLAVIPFNGDTAHGKIVLNADGSFTYTPDPDYNGVDSYTYTVVDQNGGSTTGTVTFNVTPVNDPPVAVDDSLVAYEDTPLQFTAADLLGNDSDIDGGTLVIQSVTSGPNGNVSYDSVTGLYTYRPDANYNGPDTFTYVVSDGNGGADTATVNVTVNPVNDAPVAVDDSYSTEENTAVSGNTLTNDADVDGDILGASIVSDPSHGSVTLDVNGGFVYSPDTGFVGSDSFVYQASDGKGGFDQATVNVFVSAANVAPVAKNDVVFGPEDTTITGNVLTNDTDANNDVLAVDLTSIAGPTHGTLVMDADGGFRYDPDPNYTGYDSFTYRAVDPDGLVSQIATVEIYALPVNDVPKAANDAVETDVNTPIAIDVLANDTDPDGDRLTVPSQGLGKPAHGSVSVDADGIVTYEPDTDYTGPDSFTYLIVDANGRSSTATVSIVVTPSGAAEPNHAPVANPDSISTTEDTPVSGNVFVDNGAGADTDTEDGQPVNAYLVTGATHGVVELDSDGNFTYTPGANFNGTDSFIYRAVDSAGDSSTAIVTINVGVVNDPPVTSPDFASGAMNTTLGGNVLSNDYDPENTALWSELVVTSSPQHGSVQLNQDGSFQYVPAADYVGADQFSYRAIDQQGADKNDVVSLELLGQRADDPPVTSPESPAEPYSLPLEARTGYDPPTAPGPHAGHLTAVGDHSAWSQTWIDLLNQTAKGANGLQEGLGSSLSSKAPNHSSPDELLLMELRRLSESSHMEETLGVLAWDGAQSDRRAGAFDNETTGLFDFPNRVATGRRLDFEINDGLDPHGLGLDDPDSNLGGHSSDSTPLEGFEAEVQNGKRLDFGYQPIEKSLSLDIDELRLADLLEV